MTKRCRYCAEEIQAAAIICRFCGRSQQRGVSEPASFIAYALAGFFVFVLALVIAYAATHEAVAASFYDRVASMFSSVDSTQAQGGKASAEYTPPPPPPPPPPLIVGVANDPAVRLEAGHYVWSAINLDDSRPCKLTGHITVLDGGSRDVDVFLVDDDGLQNLQNNNRFDVYFSRRRTSALTLDQPIQGRKQYYLVVSNSFSVFTGKLVSLENIQGICEDPPLEYPTNTDEVE